MLEPVKKARLYEDIVRQLTKLINNGALKPGDRLPTERALAAQLDVSRTAIREALRALEAMGFIESKVGEGTFVRAITMENVMSPFSSLLKQDQRLIDELREARILIETEIARMAAKRLTPESARLIEDALDHMADEIAQGVLGLGGDNMFHTALAKAADNQALCQILDLCSDLLSSSREAGLMKLKDQSISLVHHQKIYHAVREGDGELAATLMKHHLEFAAKLAADAQTEILMKTGMSMEVL